MITFELENELSTSRIFNYFALILLTSLENDLLNHIFEVYKALNQSVAKKNPHVPLRTCKHSHKKWKDNLETGIVYLYFCLNLKYLRWPYRVYIKPAKNGNFCEEMLSENDFKAF